MKDLSNENIVHIKKDGVEYIQFRRLLEYPEIQHCYTLRNDNLDFKINGNIQVLETSYEKICDALKIDKKKIVKPIQTHTDIVEVVTNTSKQFKEVDGLITNKDDITLSTSSADCTSLLLYDPIKKVIGSIHSGWRGTLQRIGQKAVKKMIDEFGCNPEDIICCICPHIRKCHFEVENDVKEIFEKEFKDLKIEQNNDFAPVHILEKKLVSFFCKASYFSRVKAVVEIVVVVVCVARPPVIGVASEVGAVVVLT